MKIRIQGNAVRIRLSKKDLEKLTNEGSVIEYTTFGAARFSYAVERTDMGQLSATFENGKITMLIPEAYIKDWATNDVVGFDATMQTSTTDTLYLLIEKDFKCLDQTTEDQSDQYENPKQNC